MSHGQEVVEAFKKFDKDGNGTISREELGAVLKALDAEAWDDPSIDRLLAMADTSGDGVLWFEEFVRWMLADDVGGKAQVKGNFTFVVAGCSREELNGEYVQQEKFYGRRPVFYCAENKRVLFYQKRRQSWQIYWTPGKKASALVKTARAPHMLLEGQCWSVWTEGTFCDIPTMKCSIAPELSPEERQKQAPEVLFFDSPNMFCVMKKHEKIWQGRNMYVTDDQTCFSVYIDGQDGFYGWAFFHAKDAQRKNAGYKSCPTKCYSPHQCLWTGGVSVCAEPREVVKVNVVTHELGVEPWVDPDFPPSEASFGETFFREKAEKFGGSDKIVWTRLSELTEKPQLFDEDPFDINQGGIGNCWFISALAALGEYPSHLRDRIFKTKDITPNRCYEICLFEFAERAWKVFEVDDLVPCYKSTSPHHADSPLFCRARSLWAPLLEKVFAKYCGAYEMLQGGGKAHNTKLDPVQVLCMLTGGAEVKHFRQSVTLSNLWVTQVERDVTIGQEPTSEKKGKLFAWASIYEEETVGKRMRYRVRDDMVKNEKFQQGTEEGWITTHVRGIRRLALSVAAGWTYTHKTVSPHHKDWRDASATYATQHERIEGIEKPEVLWKKLMEIDEASGITTGWFHKDTGMGLVNNHQYTIVQCKEVGDFKLVCVRNPWGHDEWTGAWADDSEEWEAFPEVAQALKLEEKDDGLFWMEFEDFYARAEEICACVPPKGTMARG